MKALVVGHGHMGRLHAKVLCDLGYDVDTEDPRAEAEADFRALTTRQRCAYGVVCVAVPIQHLAEEAATLSECAGSVLIEKPGGMYKEEIELLQSVMTEPRVAVGFVERFNPVVRRLRAELQTPITWARFIRQNRRESLNVYLDLTSHDVDLAHWLEVPKDQAFFDSRGGCETQRREIVVVCEGGFEHREDLMAHSISPLHAQWHTFLSGGNGYATLTDAAYVLDHSHLGEFSRT